MSVQSSESGPPGVGLRGGDTLTLALRRAGGPEGEAGEGALAADNVAAARYRVWWGTETREIGITWCRSILGHSFVVSVQGQEEEPPKQLQCKIDFSSLSFWRRQCRKTLEVEGNTIEIYWDCSSAKFSSGPEPLEGFYVALVWRGELFLLLGDMQKEARRRVRGAKDFSAGATLIAKREHVFGRKSCESRARFAPGGKEHMLEVECCRQQGGPGLTIKVDGVAQLHVEHLTWQFRGNKTISVDGAPVEVFWDVYNWLFGGFAGYAIFMFRTDLPHPASSLEEQPSHPSFDVMPRWSGSDRRAYAKAWLGKDGGGSDGDTLDSDSSGFSLTLVAWRHDLRTAR